MQNSLPPSFIPEEQGPSSRIVRHQYAEEEGEEKSTSSVGETREGDLYERDTHAETEEEKEGDEIILQAVDDWHRTKSLKELKDMCVSKGLVTSGTKRDLVQRLRGMEVIRK